MFENQIVSYCVTGILKFLWAIDWYSCPTEGTGPAESVISYLDVNRGTTTQKNLPLHLMTPISVKNPLADGNQTSVSCNKDQVLLTGPFNMSRDLRNSSSPISEGARHETQRACLIEKQQQQMSVGLSTRSDLDPSTINNYHL